MSCVSQNDKQIKDRKHGEIYGYYKRDRGDTYTLGLTEQWKGRIQEDHICPEGIKGQKCISA